MPARLHINADGTQATFIDDAGDKNGRWIPLPTARVVLWRILSERTSGIWTGWVQLCGACAGIAFNAGEWPLLTLTVPREELFLKREMSPFMRTPPTGADVLRVGKRGRYNDAERTTGGGYALNGEAYKQQVARAVAEIRRASMSK